MRGLSHEQTDLNSMELPSGNEITKSILKEVTP
jgi:hypothetical protein